MVAIYQRGHEALHQPRAKDSVCQCCRWSWCLPCGFGSIVPYFYVIYFAVLLGMSNGLFALVSSSAAAALLLLSLNKHWLAMQYTGSSVTSMHASGSMEQTGINIKL